MATRIETLQSEIPRGGKVIEIGPSINPIAPKSEGWNAYVLDHLDQEGLIAKYLGHPHVDTTHIEEVDFVWNGGPLSSAVPADLHGTFDAFVASHVIEHTPDLIAFLGSAETLLKSTGVVILAVPDTRYCFDYFQTVTTTGQLLAAKAEQRVRHNRWLGFDYAAYAANDKGEGAWGQHPSRGIHLVHELEEARDLSNAMGPDAGYVDLHAWRFTPSSFELLLLELAALGETDWQVERSSVAIGCEFYAWLRRGGKTSAASLSPKALSDRRLNLLKMMMIEARAQIDWLLAGEPNLVVSSVDLLPSVVAAAPEAAPPPAPGTVSSPAEGKPTGSGASATRFVDWFPSADNAGRAFEGEWSSAVPGLATTGAAQLFEDGRVTWFGERIGGFAGKQVLELGPLEGGHTYMMTQAGANVLAIESNLRAWMRCLVVKDALDMRRANFLLGDFVQYISSSPPKVDFTLASGVLYHMTDPVRMLQDLCLVSSSIGLWTHYFDPVVLQGREDLRSKFDFAPRAMTTRHGRQVRLYDQQYLKALEWEGFCGGSAPGSCWLRKEDIVGVLEDEGFQTEVFLDQPDHQNGPSFCVFARRR
jgi:SAM-dependent methyltransferase